MISNGFIQISSALSNKKRLTIVATLSINDVFIRYSDVTSMLGVSPSTASHHLKILVQAGILQAGKDGRFCIYILNRKALDEYLKFINSIKKSTALPIK